MRQRSTRVRRAVAVSVSTPGVALGAQKEQKIDKKSKKVPKKSKKEQKRAQIGLNRVKYGVLGWILMRNGVKWQELGEK
jgi:hypothetical protein